MLEAQIARQVVADVRESREEFGGWVLTVHRSNVGDQHLAAIVARFTDWVAEVALDLPDGESRADHGVTRIRSAPEDAVETIPPHSANSPAGCGGRPGVLRVPIDGPAPTLAPGSMGSSPVGTRKAVRPRSEPPPSRGGRDGQRIQGSSIERVASEERFKCLIDCGQPGLFLDQVPPP